MGNTDGTKSENKNELTGIILFFFAVTLILMYYLPESVTGVAGSVVRDIGFGLIGSAAIMIPLFILYAGIDFFIEKRAGVSPIRVRSVILLMVCVSSLLAVSSMDFGYFRNLCVDDLDGKIKATNAISLLWRSGPDSSLISNPASSANVLPGGLIGGGIAVSLFRLMGKAISILALIVFLLSQILVVFQISLKKTAKKTASAIKVAVQRSNNGQVLSGRGSGFRGNNDNYNVNRKYYPGTNNPKSPFVNAPTNAYNIPLYDVNYNRPTAPVTPSEVYKKPVGPMPVYTDPFSTGLPIDRKTGFVDVSAKEFGVTDEGNTDSITYVNKTYDTNGSAEAPRADFSYTPTPKTHGLETRIRKQDPKLSFLPDRDKRQDFLDVSPDLLVEKDGDDLSNGTLYPDAIESSEERSRIINQRRYDYEDDIEDDDMPLELVDDPYDYSGNPERTVRRPVVHVKTPGDDNTSIPVNEDVDEELKGGREVITNTAPDTSVSAVPDPAPASVRPKKKEIGRYIPPPLSFLAEPVKTNEQKKEEMARLQARAHELEETLASFGIRGAEVINITHGPAITRFELTIEKGIKVSRVLSLQDDIAMAMAAVSVRIEAPIPGKSAIGIEIPNSKVSAVHLRGLLAEPNFKKAKPLEVPLGRDIPNMPIMCDLAKMPHLLIAGSTGSGKSVCINTILTSILYHSSPDQVRMILIDPKVVELSIYNGIPHLYMPVVTDPKKAANALKWAVIEMERRYKLFAESSVRDLSGYNDYLAFNGEKPLPLVLIVIDELADLMTVASKEVEIQISRLAAMARAAGLHLIIATQRPSVDVLTGVIKANVPSRVAFAVSSGVDSRTILDSVGAEKLLGKGDMLYAPLSAPKPIRGQGAFVSDKEVESVVKYLKNRYGDLYDETIMKTINSSVEEQASSSDSGSSSGSNEDELLDQAVNTVIEVGNASVSILQRRLGVGYPRAARLIDVLEQKHVIGPFEGSKPRKVLITKTDWLEMKAKGQT